jgi:protein-S-isoprenylcysteine O-methyltransferase Ste14
MPVWFRALIFLILVPGTVAAWVPWWIAGAPHHPWNASHGAWQLGALLTFVGWAVLLWCAREFALRGRGTPAPYDAPRELVTSGFYRFTRNPMYVGVSTAIFGQALWYQSIQVAIYGVIAALCFEAVIVLYEEPALRRAFGESYVEYCRRVPRWIAIRF